MRALFLRGHPVMPYATVSCNFPDAGLSIIFRTYLEDVCIVEVDGDTIPTRKTDISSAKIDRTINYRQSSRVVVLSRGYNAICTTFVRRNI